MVVVRCVDCRWRSIPLASVRRRVRQSGQGTKLRLRFVGIGIVLSSCPQSVAVSVQARLLTYRALRAAQSARRSCDAQSARRGG